MCRRGAPPRARTRRRTPRVLPRSSSASVPAAPRGRRTSRRSCRPARPASRARPRASTSNAAAIPAAIASRSSVTCTKPVSVWISRSSNRSPAASRSRASFSSVAAALRLRTVSGCSGVPLLQVGVDPDDLRVLRRDRQHLRPAAADDDRRVRLLHRLRLTVETVDLVVLAVERERLGTHEPLHDGERLVEPGDAHARGGRGRSRRARSRRSSTRRRCPSSSRPSLSTSTVAASVARTTGCL